MPNNTISVLIPSYNHEKYIQECILSVVQQTYANIELIVIDDGSRDSTQTVVKDLQNTYKSRFTRFEFIARENRGVVKTCKELLSYAEGDYVLIMASDDVLKPDAITTLWNFLSKNVDYVLAVGDNELIDSNSQIIAWDKKRNSGTGPAYQFKTFGQFLQYRNKHINFNTSQFGSYTNVLKGNHVPNGYLIRKDAILKTNAYDVRAPLEDWYLMLQLSKIGKFKYINNPLFQYRWHNNNTAKNINLLRNYSRETLLYEINTILTNNIQPYSNHITRFLETNNKKVYFKFGNFFQIYKVKNIIYKKYMIQFGRYHISKKIYYDL